MWDVPSPKTPKPQKMLVMFLPDFYSVCHSSPNERFTWSEMGYLCSLSGDERYDAGSIFNRLPRNDLKDMSDLVVIFSIMAQCYEADFQTRMLLNMCK
mmetsp:Transcript_38476/g.80598  ORF Transcript_38476/g.80598 Transcript_38476/m.80598 type:complete len:98 (-) Transcript_38476:15-308(-)